MHSINIPLGRVTDINDNGDFTIIRLDSGTLIEMIDVTVVVNGETGTIKLTI